MAERTRSADPEPQVNAEPYTETPQLHEKTDVTEPETTEKSDAPLNPALQQFVGSTEGRTPVRDPGPGGWAWRSDRDGIISALSPKGIELLGNGMENSGTTVLDILGLNHKVGHPVARAFQRRSTIHDAPIFLASMEPSQQHWTLEATPFFSSCGGIFEGYEGILTPVASKAENDEHLLPSEEEASALFLDEVAPARRAAIGAGNAFTQTANITDMPTQQPTAASLQTRPVEVAKTAQSTLQAAEKNTDNASRTSANSALEEIISDTLRPLTEALENRSTANTIAAKPKPAAAMEPETGETAEPKAAESTDLNLSEVRATLGLLEEALARLTIAGKNAGDIQVRLQSEIASACARTLRDLLSK